MRWILSTLVLFFSLPCPAKERGFERPLLTQERKAGLSRLVEPPQEIREICWAYPGSALSWREDPGIKGIEEVTLRENANSKALCSANDGAGKRIPIEGAWPLGRAGRFLFIQDEPMGNLAILEAIDLSTGKPAFSASRDVNAELSVEQKNSVVSLTFYKGLELPCVPSKQDPACWDKVKATQKIPEGLALKAPDCEAAFRKEPVSKKEPRALGISVPVRVPNLLSKELEFLPGRARCEALP